MILKQRGRKDLKEGLELLPVLAFFKRNGHLILF
jgi:hypothetical protein